LGETVVSDPLSPALVEEFRQLDTCAVSNAIESFELRLRNEGFTDRRIRCLFDDMPPVIGHAVTATIRCSTPPPVGHQYVDRTDWWSSILQKPAPRIVVVQDVDDDAGLGAFVGEVHAHILRALGCVAFVTNGAVRDLPDVRRAGLQTFAAATTPSHAFAHIVGFDEPVQIAGLSVAPGDVLFGDRHGVVNIPASVAADLPAVVAAMRARERRVIDYCQSPEFSVAELRSMVAELD
jgi:4-hydroxy-4-methyl-2-oxoglutarate aldolase